MKRTSLPLPGRLRIAVGTSLQFPPATIQLADPSDTRILLPRLDAD
jgi:hypothetical protein